MRQEAARSRPKLAECPRFRRGRGRVSFEQSLRERLLSIPPRPRSVVAPLLLPVDLERIAPGNLADLVPCRPAAAPRSFDDSGHGFLLSVRSARVVRDIHTRCVYTTFTPRGTRAMHRRLNITLPEETIRLIDRVAAKGDRSR